MKLKKILIGILLLVALATFTVWGALKANQVSMGHADFTSASAAAYTAGDCIGTAQQISVTDFSGRVLILDQILIRDAAAQKKGVRFYFFDANPPAAVDNAAFGIGSSLPNLIGIVDVRDGDYYAVDTAAVVSQPLLYKMVAAGASVWVVAVTQPDVGVPTYGSGGKLSVDFHFTY